MIFTDKWAPEYIGNLIFPRGEMGACNAVCVNHASNYLQRINVILAWCSVLIKSMPELAIKHVGFKKRPAVRPDYELSHSAVRALYLLQSI